MILLVDDEEVIQKSLSRYLKDEGYDVTTAKNGDEAIGKLEQKQYDLVMTDLAMEGTDGIQVLMKAKEFYPEISVMILTGYGSMESAIDALRHGADDYFLKTCDYDELVFRVTHCLKIHKIKKRIHKPTETLEKTNKKLRAEINKRKQIEKQLHIKDSITEIFLTASYEEMFTKVLEIILEALGSKHGFFGYIDPIEAIIYPSITEGTQGKNQLPDTDITRPHEGWGNLWTQALKKKKVLYHNNYLHFSQGQRPMKRAMIAPVIHHDEPIGVIAVSNKSTDYTEDDRILLKCIANHVAPIQGIRLEKIREEQARKQAQEKLRLHKEWEKSFQKKQLHTELHELKSELGKRKSSEKRAAKAIRNLDRGDYKEAKRLFIQEITENKEKLALATYYLGNITSLEINFKKAAEHYSLAAELSPNNGKYLNATGKIWHELGKFQKALSYYNKVLEIDKNAYGEEHPDVARDLNNIGSVWDSLGKYHKALDCFEQALKIWKRIYGEEYPSIGTTINNIGLAWYNLGEFHKALDFFEQALALDKKAWGEKHPDVARDLNSIGGVWDSLGDYHKALNYYEQALAIKKKVYGEKHPIVGTTINNIGAVWYKLEDYHKALVYYEQALEIDKKAYSKEHPDIARDLNNIGAGWYKLGDYYKALGYYEQALKIDKKIYGEQHPDVATDLNNIGLAWYNQGEHQKALNYYEQALRINKKAYGENHSDIARDLNNIALIWYNLRNYHKAKEFLEAALAIRLTNLGAEHPYTKSISSLLHIVMAKLSAEQN